MRRILEIIPTLGVTGGAETFYTNLLISFAKQGYDPAHLKAVCLYKDSNSIFAQKLRKAGIDITFLDKKPGIDFKVARELRKFIRGYQPDIIHTHSLCIVTLFLALGMRHKNIKIFHTIHNVADKECPKKSQERLYFYLFKKKWFIPIGISYNVAVTIQKVFKYDMPFYVNNGSPIEEFKNDTRIADRKIDFIHVGRFEEQKDHRFLLNSFVEVVKKKPEAKLICVGTGTLFYEIKELVGSLGIEKNVELLGLRSDVKELLADSKVFLLPSLYEGNPISILEAMAAGLPIIATKVGGVPDIVKEKRNGYLFDVGDKETFVQYMLDSFQNVDELETIRLNNIADSAKYGIDECAHTYLDYFEKQ